MALRFSLFLPTAQRNEAKVMFLRACVILFRGVSAFGGKGLPLDGRGLPFEEGGSALGEGGLPLEGGGFAFGGKGYAWRVNLQGEKIAWRELRMEGDLHGEGSAWREVCMEGVCMEGGLHGGRSA